MIGEQDDMADHHYSEVVSQLLPAGQFRLLENTPHPIEKVDQQLLSGIVIEFFN